MAAIIIARVQPRASRNGLSAAPDGGWKLAVTAPPAAGRANRACVELLAATLGCPKGRVTLKRGASARVKTFEIEGATQAEIERRLKAALHS